MPMLIHPQCKNSSSSLIVRSTPFEILNIDGRRNKKPILVPSTPSSVLSHIPNSRGNDPRHGPKVNAELSGLLHTHTHTEGGSDGAARKIRPLLSLFLRTSNQFYATVSQFNRIFPPILACVFSFAPICCFSFFPCVLSCTPWSCFHRHSQAKFLHILSLAHLAMSAQE